MLKVYSCIAHQHDLRLVALAAFICALASFTAVNLLDHARRTNGWMEHVWLGVAAMASGFGIWATHFIAMLAFSPGLPTGYNSILTLLSLVAAILLTGAGLSVAVLMRFWGASWLGGAIVGGGIAVMHYTGMAAFEVPGIMVWDWSLVAISILLGVLIGAVALPVGLRRGSFKWKICGALLLTLAICGLHFTAMGAVAVLPDGTIDVSPSAVPSGWLAIAVALASLAILLLASAGLTVDIRDRRHAERETDRMRGFANAAFEGLIVCNQDTIVAVNNSFVTLVGRTAADLAQAQLADCLPDETVRQSLRARPNQPLEAMLMRADGAKIPVELILRPVEFSGGRHHAIAVRDLRDRKRAEQHISYLAHHDALTGLPNRGSFDKKLDHAIETVAGTGKRLAVLCLDLDRFKNVNDLFGHAAGDGLLRSVAQCTAPLLAEGQIMARLGGDEFAIVMPELADLSAAGRLAERLLEALARQMAQSATGTGVSASIGIAVYPDDATDRNSLLSQADTALYKAKAEGRGNYRFFESAMGAQVRERRLLEHDLRHAVARHELSLVYQPQTKIATGEIVGFEALARWQHTTRGDISPAVFIPVAEESGAILHIGEWVLRTACAEAFSWTNSLSVAVNVSPIQLHHANFAQLVHEVLLQTGLPAERLELEITETALIRDLNRALVTLRQLKALGLRIAMDDFGTGYSSLANLRAFPFDKIKIDRSFVRSVDSNTEAAAIVRAVLGLGRGLNLPVLAEGVETQGELGFLDAESCCEAQGYLIGRPAGIGSFTHITRALPPPLPTADSRVEGFRAAS
jgi:diguanylate cyclase (GGDEF)-like protein/PAS domain S-box-containing protein